MVFLNDKKDVAKAELRTWGRVGAASTSTISAVASSCCTASAAATRDCGEKKDRVTDWKARFHGIFGESWMLREMEADVPVLRGRNCSK